MGKKEVEVGREIKRDGEKLVANENRLETVITKCFLRAFFLLPKKCPTQQR